MMWKQPGRKKIPKTTVADVGMDRRQYYGGMVYDGILHTCTECGHNLAFGYSVRIEQSRRAAPVCADCRLKVGRAA